MSRAELILKNTQQMPRRAGRAVYIRHLKGIRLTREEAIQAKCLMQHSPQDTGVAGSDRAGARHGCTLSVQ